LRGNVPDTRAEGNGGRYSLDGVTGDRRMEILDELLGGSCIRYRKKEAVI
jgi:hypothetical protein